MDQRNPLTDENLFALWLNSAPNLEQGISTYVFNTGSFFQVILFNDILQINEIENGNMTVKILRQKPKVVKF